MPSRLKITRLQVNQFSDDVSQPLQNLNHQLLKDKWTVFTILENLFYYLMVVSHLEYFSVVQAQCGPVGSSFPRNVGLNQMCDGSGSKVDPSFGSGRGFGCPGDCQSTPRGCISIRCQVNQSYKENNAGNSLDSHVCLNCWTELNMDISEPFKLDWSKRGWGVHSSSCTGQHKHHL